jgi:hypothetical protein
MLKVYPRQEPKNNWKELYKARFDPLVGVQVDRKRDSVSVHLRRSRFPMGKPITLRGEVSVTSMHISRTVSSWIRLE